MKKHGLNDGNFNIFFPFISKQMISWLTRIHLHLLQVRKVKEMPGQYVGDIHGVGDKDLMETMVERLLFKAVRNRRVGCIQMRWWSDRRRYSTHQPGEGGEKTFNMGNTDRLALFGVLPSWPIQRVLFHLEILKLALSSAVDHLCK